MASIAALAKALQATSVDLLEEVTGQGDRTPNADKYTPKLEKCHQECVNGPAAQHGAATDLLRCALQEAERDGYDFITYNFILNMNFISAILPIFPLKKRKPAFANDYMIF